MRNDKQKYDWPLCWCLCGRDSFLGLSGVDSGKQFPFEMQCFSLFSKILTLHLNFKLSRATCPTDPY